MAAAGRARARWCCRRRWRPSRRSRGSCSDGDGLRPRRGRRRGDGQPLRPHERLPRPDGHVHRARSPTCMSHGADGLRQVAEDAVLNANYILARAEGRDDAGLRRPLHARGAVRRRLPEGHRRHHPRLRQGDDRRGLSPDDHVLPAGRARRDADRADRDRVQGRPRPVHRRPALARRAREGRQRGRGFKAAPRFAPRRRLDETLAARKPVLRWRPSNAFKQAAE